MFMEPNGNDKTYVGDFGEAVVYNELRRRAYRVFPIKESFVMFKYLRTNVDKDRFFGVDIEVMNEHRHFAVQVKTKQPRGCGNDTGMEEYQWKRLLMREQKAGFPFIMVIFVERRNMGTLFEPQWVPESIYGEWVCHLKENIWESYNTINGTKVGYYQPHKCSAWNDRDHRWMVYWRVKDMKPIDNLLSTLVGYGLPVGP